MDVMEATDPLPGRKKKSVKTEDIPFLTAGLTYNLKKGIKSHVEDIEAEYDNIETVMAIKDALEGFGCRVILLEADDGMFEKFKQNKIDLAFNIAEGIRGRGREAQVPAILNFLGIPYTGSDETTLCIALDKALTKRVLSTFRIKTPKYRLIHDHSLHSVKGLQFPVIVKPNAEGSSKGIWNHAVAGDQKELSQLLESNKQAYGQSMLVEEFISGREFTVGIVGNGNETRVFPPMEIVYRKKSGKYNVYSYQVKKDYKQYIDYVCPASLDKVTEEKMIQAAMKIYQVLDCKDFSRIDFRLSEDNEVYFIEINPLPGLAPGYSDYPMIAGFNGVDYKTLIGMILNSCLKRHGMQPVTERAGEER